MESFIKFIVENIFSIILTIMCTILSVLLTKILIQNGKEMKGGFKRMDTGFRLIALLIVEEDKEKKKKILRKMIGEI